ncbi:flagellar hook-basal body complex protein FliE [Pelagimonas varians]|uniref:Flagellar hook-basal body protein FliE n=1 Tax=Pelagimonas varians TaxID=696760 RepID=A0A238KKY7_9RHOB|nr:flagellar hook-basal body complex protein FliE [Pelagimonas varians]PYG29589.1 flagellar hook-basal body complex protein FliE [Pelagimonas varians]SMX42696.1 flagellar hook-basal body protein FliE [Pelagimonas varians]
MDVRSLFAAQKYAASMPAMEPKPEIVPQVEKQFADFANEFSNTLKQAEGAANSAMVGSADPHALVEALAQSELAVETVVAVRDKVVEAYQEILRMPV